MLKDQEKNKGAMGIGKKVSLHDERALPTLKDQGISKKGEDRQEIGYTMKPIYLQP